MFAAGSDVERRVRQGRCLLSWWEASMSGNARETVGALTLGVGAQPDAETAEGAKEWLRAVAPEVRRRIEADYGSGGEDRAHFLIGDFGSVWCDVSLTQKGETRKARLALVGKVSNGRVEGFHVVVDFMNDSLW